MTTNHADDGSLVGSPAILKSPNVVEPTSNVNQPVPTPSIYKDSRGEIHNLSIAGRNRINLLSTRAQVMRSGDLHPNTQHDFVFSGKVRVWTLQSSGETLQTDYGPCSYVAIPPYTPHIFEFLQDTVMAEWWDGPFYAWFYEPYRKIVQESFVVSSGGRMMKLHRGDDGVSAKLLYVLLGIGIGYLIGSKRK